MSKGTVKFFNESKGFGFIKDDASDKEYFVHVSGLNDQVRENDEVTFDLQDGKKGLNAVNVKLAQFKLYKTFIVLEAASITKVFEAVSYFKHISSK